MHFQTVGFYKSTPVLAKPSMQFCGWLELEVGADNLFPGSHFKDIEAARKHCCTDVFVSREFATTRT